MKIHHLNQQVDVNHPAITIGFFDGVHKGHRKVIDTLRREAQRHQVASAVVTFWPHPRWITGGGDKLKLLSTLAEKTRLIELCGVDHLIIIPFTPEFATLSAMDFLKQYIADKIKPGHLIIGYDHHFGNNREGDTGMLKKVAGEFKFILHTVNAADENEIAISSTKIRNLLLQGEVEKASLLLGRRYDFSSVVVKGLQIGREIGYPTANLHLEDNYKLLPADGVYLVIADFETRKEFGLLNIGKNPTIPEKKLTHTIELHILNVNENLYNQHIHVSFICRLRDEMLLYSKEALTRQIATDIENARQIIRQKQISLKP